MLTRELAAGLERARDDAFAAHPREPLGRLAADVVADGADRVAWEQLREPRFAAEHGTADHAGDFAHGLHGDGVEIAEQQPAAEEADEEVAEPVAETKSRNSGMADESARYGESLLREMLGAEPMQDKNGK